MISVSKTALFVLRWSLGVVLFSEAALLALSHAAAHTGAHAGVPAAILLVIAVAEMLACVLLVIPHTMRVDAKLLIGVIAFAALVHVLHGSFRIEALVIYAAATWVVLSQTSQTTAGINE